jgi:hypothetical protein
MIRRVPESQDNCDSGGMPPMAIGAKVAPPNEYRQTPVWLLWGAYRRLLHPYTLHLDIDIAHGSALLLGDAPQ